MKRRQLVFVSVVFSTVLTGFVLEHQRARDPFEFISITSIGAVELPPVELPTGDEVLEGRVVDEDGQPIGDVGVHLFRAHRSQPETGPQGGADPLLWTRTAPDGRFRIEGAPSGEFEVALLALERPTARFSVSLPTKGPMRWQVPARATPPSTLAEIESLPLTGRLAPPVGTLPTPHPVGGYEIWFEPLEGPSAWLAGRVPMRVDVDPNGRFKIEQLVCGRYLVRVLPSWARGGTWPILEEIAYTHPSPGELEPRSPDPSLPLRLRSGTLGGRAFDEEGLPLEGALVKVWPTAQPDHLWPTLATDTEGTFLIRDLPPGPYRVRLRAGGAAFEADVTIRIGARTTLTPPALDPRQEGEGR